MMLSLIASRSPAEQLLSDIRAAGYTVEEFIALLRVDPIEDTRPLPPISDNEFWVIPPRRAS